MDKQAQSMYCEPCVTVQTLKEVCGAGSGLHGRCRLACGTLSAGHCLSLVRQPTLQPCVDTVLSRRARGPVVGVLGCMAERLKDRLLERQKLVDVVAGPDAYRDLPRLLAIVQVRRASPGALSCPTKLSLRCSSRAGARPAPVRCALTCGGDGEFCRTAAGPGCKLPRQRSRAQRMHVWGRQSQACRGLRRCACGRAKSTCLAPAP